MGKISILLLKSPNILRSTTIFLKLFFFMIFRIHLKLSETHYTSFLRHFIFLLSINLKFSTNKIILALQAQVWCLDFSGSATGRYYFHYCCFSNSYVWPKFLKKIEIKIGFCFLPRADFSSIVKQNSLPVLCVFNSDLWLNSNGLSHSKSN
jgi:hypothetical protein